ncbi:hypothetical protein P3342_000566 [Pyrenophora teres f. teres]|nr:hypothetical protein P3342_000566 [Pyrenophora teres f. teres]
MELQRKEYPAMLTSLSPGQAVTVLDSRMRHVGQLNNHIADWLQERRRVEEQYVAGLRKLANKHPPDESSDLGIFTTPWQKIVSATEAVAHSHAHLASRIEADVERPLRDFAVNNREIQAMGNIQGNLAAIAKDIDTAQKKQAKLRDKGSKAKASAVADAVQDIEKAELQWDSQAPYVFEQLQAIDETRLNHLRDVLTQFQTLEVDQVERSRTTTEDALNAMLNIETADEVQTWSLRMRSGEALPPSRKLSSTGATPSRGLAPPPIPGPGSPTAPDDNGSLKSANVPEKHSSNPLKRLGTVLGRRKSAHPYGRAASPERTSSSNLGSAFGGFGKGKSKDRENQASSLSSTAERPTSPLRRLSQRPSISQRSDSPSLTRQASTDGGPNGTIPESSTETETPNPVNGTAPVQESIPELKEPLSPPPIVETQPEPEKDAEGFSVPPSAIDAITEAEREAGYANSEGLTTSIQTRHPKCTYPGRGW